MKKFVIAICVLFIAFSAFAVPYYDKGNQELTIGLGSLLPTSLGDDTIHSISIDWQIFIHPYISLGLSSGFKSMDIVSGNLELPLLFKMQYFPSQGNICDVVLSLGVGLCLDFSKNASMKTYLEIPLEMAVRIYLNDHWGLGARAGLTAMANLSLSKFSISTISTFMPLNVIATYRF